MRPWCSAISGSMKALRCCLEALERSRLVALDQARIADHVGRENGGEATVDAGGGHGVTSKYIESRSILYASRRKRRKLEGLSHAARDRQR